MGLAINFGMARGETVGLKSPILAGQGWHPWYEVKADPENTENVVVCGTKWDSRNNSPFGFVYSSHDGGASWHTTLEDRGSTWVTEQSCTFGPHHTAYFLSEASKVIDGMPHHEEGKARLFLSTDAGEHWTETMKTGWADYSTSAFNTSAGKVYTFYNAWYTTHEPGSAVGGTVGLLLFSADGREVSGPFIEKAMRTAGYHGVFPVDATALKSGAVVALYSAKRETKHGWKEDLGIVRADQPGNPSLTSVVIAHPSMDAGCFNFSDASMTYDPARDELFVAYVDGCKAQSRIVLTASLDGGKTWTQSATVITRSAQGHRLYFPTLAATPNKGLVLLWEEGADRRTGGWFASYVRDSRLVGDKAELSQHSDNFAVHDDSLWTSVDRTEEPAQHSLSGSTLTLTVLSELNNVWRGQGLTISGDHVVAVWPSQNQVEQGLNSGILGGESSLESADGSQGTVQGGWRNVAKQTAILFGGKQHFDDTTGSLEICLMLANRGKTALGVPIALEVESIRSPLGEVSITDSSNRLPGVGAVWDITSAVTGDRILPGGTTSVFCPMFRLHPSAKVTLPSERDELVVLELKVLVLNQPSGR